ncbi:nucleotide-diphospho-sugar transferase [Limtongia smithiae]|uniref:nucleotide-diphospho-sugar transferase n=1 Tax=Limtongia smithiae TaxID=1125753 RepID=UPI0034CD11E8
MSSKCVILVGGGTRGTRFRPLSLDIPKVLFPVAGRPILSHALSALAAVSSIKEVLLIGFYDDSVFKDFLTESAREFPGLSIKYLREYRALGTAGGLYHFRDAILKGNPYRLFVIHADVCCSFPLEEMLKMFEDKEAKAVILGTRVDVASASNFGCIVSEPTTKKVLHYVEKPETYISNLINGGVYLFDRSIFDVIGAARTARLEDSLAMVEEQLGEDDGDDVTETLRLEQDILVRLAQADGFYVYETRGFWRQIKTAGSAVPANSLYLQKLFQTDIDAPGLARASAQIVPPVFIDPTASVDPTAKLGPNVSIGPRARVGPGARIKEAILLEDTEVKHDACVLYSILARGVKVGAWARVEGSPITPAQHSTVVLKNGVRVQSVAILASGVSVKDEVRIENCVVLPHKDITSDVENEIIM